MRTLIVTLVLAFAAFDTAASITAEPTPQRTVNRSRPRAKHLRHFGSRRELRQFLAKLVRQHRRAGYGFGMGSADGAEPPAMTSTVTVTGGGGGGGREEEVIEVITNLQTASVDEGSIVKLRDNYLVVLRRGRLFTIDLSNNDLKTVSTINAYGPDIDPDETWYDEMLISGANIVVVGYSYDRGGTEIGLFRINESGELSYRATYHLRSNDYYSSRNYSSRLIGNKLIFYSPLDLDLEEKDPLDSFPALRRWHKGAKEGEFRPIAPATSVYIPAAYRPDPDDVTLHTVTTCTITEKLSCAARSVIGPSGNVFYVSASNVYVWASTWYSDDSKVRNRSLLFKMPLTRAEPAAIRVSGSPVDQLSFNEDDDQELNVLVRADSKGDGMWRAEVSEGEVALLRLQPGAFNNGSAAAPRHDYQQLEEPDGYSFQNRFIGDYILYGTADYSGDGNQKDASRKLFVLNRKTGAFSKVDLRHDVRRLDLLGSNGIVVGNLGDDLTFTSIKLDGPPRVIDSYTIQHAAQGETRTQGFFYKPIDEISGVLGLPVVRDAGLRRNEASREIASLIFLRNSDLRFEQFGELRSTDRMRPDDDCKASCVDWYGDARPIFARGRIFALLGYELVEGSNTGGQLREIKRLDFAPRQ